MDHGDVRELPLTDLVEDYNLYPRYRIDEQHVRRLAQALRAGAALPLILVDARSCRIVDGWHRARAYRLVHGEGGTIPAILKEYESEADLLADAVRANASHGRALGSVDRTRATVLLHQAGVSVEEIAVILVTTPAEVERRLVDVIPVQANSGAPPWVPAKPAVRHLVGKAALNQAQFNAYHHLTGNKFPFMARQLRMALETGLAMGLPQQDNRALLHELDLLEAAIHAYRAAAAA